MNAIISRLLAFFISLMMFIMPAKPPESADMTVVIDNSENRMMVTVVTDSINCFWEAKCSDESVLRVDINSFFKPDFMKNEMNQRFYFTALSKGTVTLKFDATDLKGNPLDGELTLICKVDKDLNIEVISQKNLLPPVKIAA